MLVEARRFALAIAAVITESNANAKDHDELGGLPRAPQSSERAAQILLSEWGIAGAEDCAHMLAWLFEQGHSKQYAEVERVASNLPAGTDARNVYLNSEDAKSGRPPAWTEFHQKLEVVLDYRDRVRDRRLLAWDMARLVAVAGWSARGGFLEEDEAWIWIMRAARRVQAAYASWRELGEHYVLGLAYWRPDRVGDAPAIVERLLANEKSPWRTLDWKTDLSNERGGNDEQRVFIKVSKCHACGAWKQSPSKTAYVYCDFCAALIDWDFNTAMTTKGSAMPGPKYEALNDELAPELEAARRENDRARYAALQARIYDAYVTACPAAVPPRTNDPAYRARFVAYTVNAMVEQAFDVDCQWLTREMEKATSRLVWEHDDPAKPRASSTSFWELFSAVKALADWALVLAVKSGHVKSHPDGAPPELLARMGMSMFAQGWIPYLSPADAERLLDAARLRGDYHEVPLPKTEARHCGVCGGSLHVVQGALRVVCEACGHCVDVGAIEVACAHCGGPCSIPSGSAHFPCPYCKCDVQAVRIPRPLV